MARPSKIEWTKNGKLESTQVSGNVDGEDFTFTKTRARKLEKNETPLTVEEVIKALGFKKEANAVKALILGANKMRATKARATAKLAALD